MSGFFQPPPSALPDLVGSAPPWTGRPHGPPPGVVLSELPLARSRTAAVMVAFLDAYRDGLDLAIDVVTSGGDVFRREGDGRAPDIFGRHWPMAGERRDALPAQLLRIGVQYGDGPAATNIVGHDRPLGGPSMWPLRGGGDDRHHRQGYWISPLPESGPVAIVCEWPAAEISLARHEFDLQIVLAAAERSRAVFPSGDQVIRDGHRWRLGSESDVAWIDAGTAPGMEITSAIPPVFESYCTLELPQDGSVELAGHERTVLELLNAYTRPQPWWLGYLDTGASEVVFPYAPRTKLYYGYGYVLVQAGPQQAGRWRERGFSWALPDLMFPADRSWLASTMWDDEWTCIGGDERLVGALIADARFGSKAHRVRLGENAIPPGHEAR